MQKTERHAFALFWESQQPLHNVIIEKTITINEPTLYHRLITVLRLEKHETFTLFDRSLHILCEIIEINKKNIVIALIKVEPNTILQPELTFLLPLLKRDALSETLYSLTELGCTSIQLINTQKSHHSFNDQKEMVRLQKICVAAAEQSKNFAFPTIYKPINLKSALEESDKQASVKLFFDPLGTAFFELIKNNTIRNAPYKLLIGPEGDLTKEEKALVKKHSFLFTALTPTILRAQQAATVATGLIRSLIV